MKLRSLHEEAWFSTSFPTNLGKVVNVDTSFELYPGGKPPYLGQRRPFAAPIPGDRYLIYDGSGKSWIDKQPPHDFPVLPSDWMYYSLLVFDDGSYKPQKSREITASSPR